MAADVAKESADRRTADQQRTKFDCYIVFASIGCAGRFKAKDYDA